MTILIWAMLGAIVGFLIGSVRGVGLQGAVIGVVGAILGGLVGNQILGPNPIELSWDLLATGRAIVGVLFATKLDVTGAAIGAVAASGLLVALTPSTRKATAA
jgi:hypothetical protein